MTTPLWVDCPSADAAPPVEQLRNWVTDDQHVVLRFPSGVPTGGRPADKSALVARLADALPDCGVFDGGERDGVESVTILRVLSAADVRANAPALLGALRAYRDTATALARRLAERLGVEPDRLLRAGREAGAWRGQLDADWGWSFHGAECRFENAKTGQDVEVRLGFGSEFGALDPFFFARFVHTTPGLRDLARLLRDNFHGAARVLDVLDSDGHLRTVEGGTGPGRVVRNPDDEWDGGQPADAATAWDACPDARHMLDLLRGRASARKWRLFACACGRRVWRLLTDPRWRRAVEVAEQLADGLAGEAGWAAAVATTQESHPRHADDANPYEYGIALYVCRASGLALADDIASWAGHVLSESSRAEGLEELMGCGGEEPQGDEFRRYMRRLQVPYCDLLRCVMGNPFRSGTISPDWLTSTVTALARGIYADCTWDRLPILADALSDAGSEDATLLNHLRGPGPHVRGCFALDLVLGKE
jgi:hypothetical protein